MPTSDKQGKFIAKSLIMEANPPTVWDMGCGEGTYAKLVWPQISTSTRWIGVEIWKPYVEQFQLMRYYKTVWFRDIRELPWRGYVEPGSLAIFGDVLEHMHEDEARRVILEAKRDFRYILVSIPIVHAPQGEVNGNPYEAHLKHWAFEEMHAAMGHCMAFKGHTIGLYWWDAEEDV